MTRTVAITTRTAEKTQKARRSIRASLNLARTRGRATAPMRAPRPSAARSRPYPPASSPSRRAATSGRSAHKALAGMTKSAASSRIRRTTGACRDVAGTGPQGGPQRLGGPISVCPLPPPCRQAAAKTTKETALRAKTALAPSLATMAPARARPTARARF
ncbi:MAG TPA: hypothetical protein VKL22_00715 [Actinomycetota bacterium]|nr:hypothetical protein [Actinomycetota bacterium]